MDVVWDQDVRTALSAIITREPSLDLDEKGNPKPGQEGRIRSHIQLAIHYADELSKARIIIERKKSASHPRYR